MARQLIYFRIPQYLHIRHNPGDQAGRLVGYEQ